MRFLADMGVDIRVVDWLRDSGHEALHLREHGMHRASDQAIFAKAVAEDRIVITFDLDFGTLAALAGDRSPSIVLFRLSNGSRFESLMVQPLERAWPPRLPRGDVPRSARRARSASDHS